MAGVVSAPDLVVKSTGAGVQSTAIALLIEDGTLPKPDAGRVVDTRPVSKGKAHGTGTDAGAGVVGSLLKQNVSVVTCPRSGSSPGAPDALADQPRGAAAMASERPHSGAPVFDYGSVTATYRRPRRERRRVVLRLPSGVPAWVSRRLTVPGFGPSRVGSP